MYVMNGVFKMNIYHIVFTGHHYDEYEDFYDAFVVIAENEESAKAMIESDIPHNESIESISCIGISNKSESEIVLGSFNAG